LIERAASKDARARGLDGRLVTQLGVIPAQPDSFLPATKNLDVGDRARIDFGRIAPEDRQVGSFAPRDRAVRTRAAAQLLWLSFLDRTSSPDR
jgi:hypothetical protein